MVPCTTNADGTFQLPPLTVPALPALDGFRFAAQAAIAVPGAIVSAVEQLIQAHPDVSWLWPVHQNPLVKADVMPLLDRLPPEAASRLRLTAGLGYPVLVKALRQCRIVLTDSGGIQEEAATLGLPVVIMRESTERQELVDAGGGVLVGTDGGRILAHCGALLSDTSARDAMKLSTNPFGDGLSSQRIARTLDQALTPGQAD